MTPEKQQKLFDEFPNLYSGLKYIECGDGWYDLLYRLSAKLEATINNVSTCISCGHSSHVAGWCNEFVSPETVLEDELCKCDNELYLCAVQVKEKFGGLRFYMSACNDDVEKAIREAEGEAAITCEICGASGKLRKPGWMSTWCDKCSALNTNDINE